MKRIHLRAAPVVALLALLLSAAPAAAETVPDGVLADAAVTVTVTTADSPVPGAPVTLEVLGGTGVLTTRSGVTGEDGTVAFADVWRPDAGGPALEWRARASWSETKYGADAGMPANCRLTSTVDGTTTATAAAGPAAIAIAAEGASSVACGPSLAGTVRDEEGNAFAVEEAYVSATDSTGHVWQIAFAVNGDGSFHAAVPPAESVSFFVRGRDTRVALEAGCTYTYTHVASRTVAVDPESSVDLVASEERILGACTATPRPTQGAGGQAPAPTPEPTQASGGIPAATPPFTGGGVPGLTPPATDGTAAVESAPAPIGIVLAVIAGVASLVFALAPRRRAREVRQTQ